MKTEVLDPNEACHHAFFGVEVFFSLISRHRIEQNTAKHLPMIELELNIQRVFTRKNMRL